MKNVLLESSCPKSWHASHHYDLLEVFNDISCYGYAYAYANRRKHTIELIQKIAQPAATVLDVAAAQGNFSLLLAEMGYEVTWNDLREDLIDYVKLKYEYGNINFAPGNVFDLGLEATFDVVLITEIIEHVAHPDKFLAKIANLVKPGGAIVMTTPNGGYFLNHLPKFTECFDPSVFETVQFKPNADGHIFLLHLDEIDTLAYNAGLNVVETRLFTNVLTNGHKKTEGLLKIIPGGFVDLIEKATNTLPPNIKKKAHTAMAVLFTRPAYPK